jgi:hypothetical protein
MAGFFLYSGYKYQIGSLQDYSRICENGNNSLNNSHMLDLSTNVNEKD